MSEVLNLHIIDPHRLTRSRAYPRISFWFTGKRQEFLSQFQGDQGSASISLQPCPAQFSLLFGLEQLEITTDGYGRPLMYTSVREVACAILSDDASPFDRAALEYFKTLAQDDVIKYWPVVVQID